MTSYIVVLSAIFIYVIVAMFVVHGGIWINPNEIIIGLVIKMVIVGLVEEIVYRGWGYNALKVHTTERKAIIYQL